MNIKVYSRAKIEKIMSEKGLPENGAVISFYDPKSNEKNYAPVDYSGQPVRAIQIAVADVDYSENFDYVKYFPEVNEVADFIFHAVNDNCHIICQCDFGQSRSAGCAAAILEHFEKNGISIFADDNYLPNQMIFNKLLDALEKRHTSLLPPEVAADFEREEFSRYIERANNSDAETALYYLNALIGKIFLEIGTDTLHAAYVDQLIADVYYHRKMYNEAAEYYGYALEICLKYGQNSAASNIKKMLEKIFMMKRIKIFSSRELINYFTENSGENVAAISFYEPGEKPLSLPENIKKLYVEAFDYDRDRLKLCGISYENYLPEASDIAKFIFDAYNNNFNLIFHCTRGQSMSAGCAAAAAQFFYNDGIKIFSDYNYSPNQLIYNKIYSALRSLPSENRKKNAPINEIRLICGIGDLI